MPGVVEAATPSVVINELHFNPEDDNPASEFIELFNTTGAAIDLSGWCIDGISYCFGPGTEIAVKRLPRANRTAVQRGLVERRRGDRSVQRSRHRDRCARVRRQAGMAGVRRRRRAVAPAPRSSRHLRPPRQLGIGFPDAWHPERESCQRVAPHVLEGEAHRTPGGRSADRDHRQVRRGDRRHAVLSVWLWRRSFDSRWPYRGAICRPRYPDSLPAR